MERVPVCLLLLLVCICKAHADGELQVWVDAVNGADEPGCGLRDDIPCQSIAYAEEAYPTKSLALLLYPGEYSGDDAGISFTGDSFRAYAIEGGVTISCTGPSLPSGWVVSARSAFSLIGMTFERCDTAVSVLGSPTTLTISSCTFRRNSQTLSLTAGLFVKVSNCTFEDNTVSNTGNGGVSMISVRDKGTTTYKEIHITKTRFRNNIIANTKLDDGMLIKVDASTSLVSLHVSFCEFNTNFPMSIWTQKSSLISFNGNVAVFDQCDFIDTSEANLRGRASMPSSTSRSGLEDYVYSLIEVQYPCRRAIFNTCSFGPLVARGGGMSLIRSLSNMDWGAVIDLVDVAIRDTQFSGAGAGSSEASVFTLAHSSMTASNLRVSNCTVSGTFAELSSSEFALWDSTFSNNQFITRPLWTEAMQSSNVTIGTTLFQYNSFRGSSFVVASERTTLSYSRFADNQVEALGLARDVFLLHATGTEITGVEWVRNDGSITLNGAVLLACAFQENRGSIYAVEETSILKECAFEGNTAPDAALVCGCGACSVTSSQFFDNLNTGTNGGAVRGLLCADGANCTDGTNCGNASSSLSSTFASCNFGGNTAEIGVGASAEFSHDASFVECTFKNESSGSTGGYRGALAVVGDAWSPSAPIVCGLNYFSFQGVKIEVQGCTFEWTTALGAAMLHKTTERPVYPYTDIVMIVSTLDYCGDAMRTGGDEDKFSWEVVQDEGVLALLPELSLKYFSQGSYLLTGNATSQGVFTVFVRLFGENIIGSPKGFEVRPSEWYVSTTGQDTGNCGLGSSPCQTVAFTASLALPGDVIFVDPGIYYVSNIPAVVLRENVKLMATDATATTFRFDGASGSVLRLSSGATLSGFVIEGGMDHFVEFTGDFGSIINCTFVENHSANQALIQGPVEVPLQSGAPNMVIQDCVFIHNTGNAAILMIRRHTLQMIRNEVSNNKRPLAEVGGVSLGQLSIEHSNISVSNIGTATCVLLQSGSGLLVDNSVVSGARDVAASSFVLVTPFEAGAFFHIDVIDSSFGNLTLQSLFAINVDSGRYGIKITNSSFQQITVEDSLIHALNADIEVQTVNFRSIFHDQKRFFGVPSAALIDLQGAANSISIVNCTVNWTVGSDHKPNVRATISDCGYIEIIDTTFFDNERGETGMVSIDVFDGGCTQRTQNIVLVEDSKFGVTRRDSNAGILSLNGNVSQPVTAVVSNSLFEHCSGSYAVAFGAAIRANPSWNVELYGCNITDCKAHVGVLYLAGPRNIVERCRIEDCHVNEVGGYQGAIIAFPSMLFHRNYAAQCVLQPNGTQIIASVNGSIARVTVIDSVFSGNDAIIARSSIVTNETNFHSIYEAGKWPTAVLTAADYCGSLEENPNLWFWGVYAIKLDARGHTHTAELQPTEWTSTAVVVSRSDGTVELDWGDWKPVVSGHYSLSITEIGGTVIASLAFEVVAAAMDTALSGTYGEPRIRYCPVTSVSIDVKVVDRFMNPSLIEDRSVECVVHGADNSTLSLNASYVADGMYRASFDYIEERETVSDMIMLLVESFVDGVLVGGPYNQRLYPTSIVARDSLLTDFHEESVPRASSFRIEAVNEDHELVPCDEYEQCLEVVLQPQGLTRHECYSPVLPRASCKMGVTEVTVNTTCAGEYEVIAMIGSVVVGEGRNTWSMTIFPGLPKANTTAAWLDTNEPIVNETFHVIVNVKDAYSNRHPCPIPTLTAHLVQVATTELTVQPCTNLHETKFAAVVPKQGPFTIQIAIEGTPVFSIEETAYLGSTCLPGTYGAGGISPCEACKSGTYCPSLGCTECISCPEHAGSVPNSNHTSPESCRCASGYYGVDECTKCDEACYGCEEPCVGGEQCAAPFSGEYCMSCATGDDCDHCDPYFMLVSQCYKCPSTTGIVALDIAVMIAMILMGAVATIRFQNSLAWSTLLMYISFMQSVSVLLFSYVPWPRLLRNVLLPTTVSIFNSELFALRCAGVQQSLWFILVFSFAVLQLVLVIKAGLAHVRSRMSAIFDDELGELTKDSDSATEDFISSGRPLEEFTSQAPQGVRDTRFPKGPLAVYLQSTVCAIVFCLVPLTNVISLALQCRKTPGGDLVLSTHPSVECFSSDWAILFISGAVAAGGIVFTIAVVSWLLFYQRKRHAQAVSFMHCMYKPDKFYWILVVKLREILFALAVVAMPTMILQVISGAVVLVAGLVLLVMYQPHKSRTLSAVDATLMVLQLAMLGTGSLLQIDQQSTTVAIIVMSLVGLWMGVSVLVTWGVCWPHIISRSQRLWARLTQRAQFSFSPMQALFADEDDVTESWRINPADLELVHPPIAKGANGVVYRAKYKGANVAVKTVVRSGSEEDLEATLEEFKREIRNLCRIHHPNVLLMIGACLENWSLVVEFCDRGSFYDVLKRNYRSREEVARGDLLTPVRLLSVLRGAARGMSYLHAQVPPMIHRDLKSLNILVTEGWQGKVADFGQSKRRFESQAVLTKQYIGTTRWAAPELLAGDDYGEEADVYSCIADSSYSFGVVLWEGMSGQIPFENDMWESRLAERVIAGARPEIPAYCSVTVVALIEACWHMDPLVRPSFQSICDTLDNMQPHEFARAGSDEGEDGDSERLSLHLLE